MPIPRVRPVDRLRICAELGKPPADPEVRAAFGFDNCRTPADEVCLLALYRKALVKRHLPSEVLHYASLAGKIPDILAAFLEEGPWLINSRRWFARGPGRHIPDPPRPLSTSCSNE